MNFRQPLYYIHGMDSGPQGVRSLFFKEHFPQIQIPQLPNDVPERLDILNSTISEPSCFVATSLGGLTLLLWLQEHLQLVKSMVLIAPAVGFFDPKYDTPEVREALAGLYIPQEIPTFLIAGTLDETIPIESIRKLAQSAKDHPSFFYKEFNEDHLLHSTEALMQQKDAVQWMLDGVL